MSSVDKITFQNCLNFLILKPTGSMPSEGRYLSSSPMTAVWPLWAALKSGVAPSCKSRSFAMTQFAFRKLCEKCEGGSRHARLTCLVASTLAPAFNSLLTTWSCPICDAIQRGVAPSVLAASVFAPRSRRTSRIRRWPFWAAINSAVAPS